MNDITSNIRKGKDFTKKLVGGFLIAMAVFVLVSGIFNAMGGKALYDKYVPSEDGYITISATISDIESEWSDFQEKYTHQVYVSYEYDGKTYEDIPYNVYSSSMQVGKSIEILCDPENTEKIMAKNMSQQFTSGILFSIGSNVIMAIILATIGIFVIVKGNRTPDKMLKRGLKLSATVEGVQSDRTLTEAGQADGISISLLFYYTINNL